MATFNNQWNLTYTPGSNVTSDRTILGNGKVGLYSGTESNVISQVYYSSSIVNPRNQNNMIETFNTHSVSFSNCVSTLVSQDLNMFTGILTTNQVWSPENGSNLYVSTDVYVPQHLPFCTIQTINISSAPFLDPPPPAPAPTQQSNCYPTTFSNPVFDNTTATGTIDIHHTIKAPWTGVEVEYNNNVVFDQLTNKGVYILTGQNKTTDTVVASTYYFPSNGNVTISAINKGFNVPMSDINSAFNIFQLPVPCSFSIITAHMTKSDFSETPLEEAKRIVLRVLNEGVPKARSDHVSLMRDRWKNTQVSICPKTGITSSESAKVTQLNRHIKYSLYKIIACTRSSHHDFGIIDMPQNPNQTNSVLFRGDLFLIPLLLLLCPEYTKSYLKYRYNTISNAKALAAGYGFQGAKYPYEDDALGYNNTLYWNTYSQFTIFNTALVSINIWNYYRTTRDQSWLRNIGYPVLQENAEFFASVISYDPATGYSIKRSVGLSGKVSESNNIFTNNTVKLALRFAIEAAYELSLCVNDKLNELYYNLPLLYFQDCSCPDGVGSIYKFDSEYQLQQPIPIAEPLLLFIPSYTTPTNNFYTNVAVSGRNQTFSLKANLDAYYTTVDWTNPLNSGILAISYGMYAQTCPGYIDNFTQSLDDFISHNTATSPVWGNMGNITQDSLLIHILLQGLAGYKIRGGVAESRFYYEEFSVTSLVSANMPTYWKDIKINNKTGTKTTMNQMLYTNGG